MSESEKINLPVQLKEESMALLQQIFDVANQLYAVGQFLSLTDLIMASEEQGISLNWNDVISITENFGQREQYLPPRFIIDFLLQYLEGRQIKRAMDPWCGKGVLLTALADKGIIQSGIGCTPSETDLQVAQAIGKGQPIQWQQGNPFKWILNEEDPFDLIVCWPPLDLPYANKTFHLGEQEIKIHDHSAHLLIPAAAQLLSEDGEAMFIVSDAFFQREGGNVYAHLKDFDLSVQMVIALAPGTLGAWLPMPMNLIVISRQKNKKIFAAQLVPKTDIQPLLANIKERQPGSITELGRLIAPSHFRCWREVILDEEISKMAAEAELDPFQLSELIKNIKIGADLDEDEEFEPLPNAFYFPLVGSLPVVTDPSHLKLDKQYCAQVITDTEKSFPEYVAGFFNTHLGFKVREKMFCRTFNQPISKPILLETDIYLPPIHYQTEVISTQNKIHELMFTLDQQNRKLWHHPREAPQIKQKIESLNQQDGIESWIETLPFPLASILWRYHADAETHMKNSHLFNFFEATTLFVTTVLVSAYFANRTFYQENKHQWFVPDFDHVKFLKRTTFGYWMNIGEKLSKFTHTMLQDANQRGLCLALFKTNRTDLLDAITSKDFHNILKTVNNYRNEWKAHGGVESEQVHQQRLTALESELARIRELFRGAFDNWMLIAPMESRYKNGTFHYQALSMMGSRNIFRNTTITTAEPMDADRVFLVDTHSHEPLELLPLMRMFAGVNNRELACYFYNRMDREGMRWVSYHFDEEAERRTELDMDFVKLLTDLALDKPMRI